MSRILRNYLISFLIIGLFLLAVHLINRWADERDRRSPAAAAPATLAPAAPAPAAAVPAPLH